MYADIDNRSVDSRVDDVVFVMWLLPYIGKRRAVIMCDLVNLCTFIGFVKMLWEEECKPLAVNTDVLTLRLIIIRWVTHRVSACHRPLCLQSSHRRSSISASTSGTSITGNRRRGVGKCSHGCDHHVECAPHLMPSRDWCRGNKARTRVVVRRIRLCRMGRYGGRRCKSKSRCWCNTTVRAPSWVSLHRF